MSENEKENVRDVQPSASSYGNNPISTGSHDQTITPEDAAGPSQFLELSRCISVTDMTDSLLKGLSWLDRLLAPLVLLAMILGVVIGLLTYPTFVDISADR